jgi:hypothetical protein
MTDLNYPPPTGRSTGRPRTWNGRLLAAAALGLALALPAQAEDDLRYSWFQISWAQQDVSRDASQTLIIENIPQTVDLDADDGDGIDFQASIGTWHNFYLFGGFTSTDIDITAVITNPNITEEATDEFDLTTIRGGIGYRYQLFFNTNIILEASYDSLDFDFGSLAGENFDTDDQGPGARLGIRTLLRDRLELRAFGRYTSVGDVDVNTGEIDDDVLFGGGFGFTLIRGLSITGDVEIGEIDTYSVGIRLDLSED